jgi:hypothetical protein
MLIHLTSKRGETEIVREVKQHYWKYFDKLSGQARLWYHHRQALPLIEQFRQYLRAQFGVDYERLRILDRLPIPVATLSSRLGQGNGFNLARVVLCQSEVEVSQLHVGVITSRLITHNRFLSIVIHSPY